ncbi:aldose epimerase family protein [Anaerolentibacter hominis]|uniref:aldose epimerase family protein n=1 Tax=Anaerolentibacter hominis TaxID=3079009 RepID=UPI0031B89F89
MQFKKEPFGKTAEGKQVYLYTITNNHQMTVTLCNIGCAVVSILVPDKDGIIQDVALGFDTADEYVHSPTCFGVVVGRYGNRIHRGEFQWNGNTISLEKNDGSNHLHGGSNGYAYRYWDCVEEKEDGVVFRLFSPDGDSGYPGDLTATVSYTLTEENELVLDYHTETTNETICNLTNHSYFNLNGAGSDTICNHIMKINADAITEVDSEFIPTGTLLPVAGTPLDFTSEKEVGKDIDDPYPQIQMAGGFDHNYVLNQNEEPAAVVYSPVTGIQWSVTTTSPGVQFYSGNFLNGTAKGKNGYYHPRRSGLCLETQLYPDSINQPAFPSCVVTKDSPQNFKTVWKFSIR